MAYQMKSSPAKLSWALKLGGKLMKYINKSKNVVKKSKNPITDPNKAKKTIISDDYKMRTDYSNQFIKEGILKP